jgi:hypothetical protein
MMSNKPTMPPRKANDLPAEIGGRPVILVDMARPPILAFKKSDIRFKEWSREIHMLFDEHVLEAALLNVIVYDKQTDEQAAEMQESIDSAFKRLKSRHTVQAESNDGE